MRSAGGFTLLELAIATSVLLIGFGALVSTLVASSSLGATNREEQIALEAARSAIEELKGEDFEQAFVRFNATQADDPGLGASPGSGFPIALLNVRPGDPDGFCGEILFPGDGTVLREDFVDADLGLPRDLNLDGAIDALDHADDYLLLPVRVRIRWTGEDGLRQIDLVTTLADF